MLSGQAVPWPGLPAKLCVDVDPPHFLVVDREGMVWRCSHEKAPWVEEGAIELRDLTAWVADARRGLSALPIREGRRWGLVRQDDGKVEMLYNRMWDGLLTSSRLWCSFDELADWLERCRRAIEWEHADPRIWGMVGSCAVSP
jgi:hypothetical protein